MDADLERRGRVIGRCGYAAPTEDGAEECTRSGVRLRVCGHWVTCSGVCAVAPTRMGWKPAGRSVGMPSQAPEGDERLWTYLPRALIEELRRLAVTHRRRLPQEVRVAVEEYVARQQRLARP